MKTAWTCMLLACLACCSLAPCGAANPLRYAMEQGETFAYRVTQTATTTLNTPGDPDENTSEQTVELVFRVLSSAPSGNTMLGCEVRNAAFTIKLPGGIEHKFNAARDESPLGIGATLAPVFHSLAEQGFKLELSPTGEIVRLEAPEELQESLDQATSQPYLENSRAILRQLIAPVFPPLTEKPLEEGSSWKVARALILPVVGKHISTVTYTYRGVESVDNRVLAAIEHNASVGSVAEGSGVAVEIRAELQKGNCLFDREAGRLWSREAQEAFGMTLTADGAITTGRVAQSTTVEPLDPKGLAELDEPTEEK